MTAEAPQQAKATGARYGNVHEGGGENVVLCVEQPHLYRPFQDIKTVAQRERHDDQVELHRRWRAPDPGQRALHRLGQTGHQVR